MASFSLWQSYFSVLQISKPGKQHITSNHTLKGLPHHQLSEVQFTFSLLLKLYDLTSCLILTKPLQLQFTVHGTYQESILKLLLPCISFKWRHPVPIQGMWINAGTPTGSHELTISRHVLRDFKASTSHSAPQHH